MHLVDLKQLEGHTVSVALADGSRIDDCQLVSVPRQGVAGLWVHTAGRDTILPLQVVTDVWESDSLS